MSSGGSPSWRPWSCRSNGWPSPPGWIQLLLWVLAALDVMVVAWMLSAGDWLDRTAPVVTLGGHHVVVLWLAVAGFVLLAGMALLTGGFAVAHRGQVPFVVLSGLV